MEKNLIIPRAKLFSTDFLNKDYALKVSQQNIEKLVSNSKLEISLRVTLLNAVVFGNEKDLKSFGEILHKDKIAFTIK